MSGERKIFLFFLTNEIGQSYYADGKLAKLSNQPRPLPQSPEGWFDQELSFGRNTKYFGVNRSYTQPLKFWGDAAIIVRNLFYTGLGIEQPLFIVVLKLNYATDIYELYYKGELDLSKWDDTAAESVTLNIIEGGVAKLIKSYENTMFEIPLDSSIPETFNVNINGILFKAIFTYSMVPVNISAFVTILPIVFESEQGNDVGIVKNNQAYDGSLTPGILTPFTTDTNFLFSSVREIQVVTVTGTIIFGASTSSGHLMIVTSKERTIDLIPSGPIVGGQQYILNTSIDLAGGENLFIVFQTSNSPSNTSIVNTQIFITFDSQFQDTKTVCIRPLDLLMLLIQKICALEKTRLKNYQYKVQSSLLNQYDHLCLTSGMALRGEAGAVLKTCISDFFTAFNAILNSAMGNQSMDGDITESLFFEDKNYCFDPSNIAMDLGEVSDFKISVATDYIFSNLEIGYPEQKYDEKTGNQEFNTTAKYKAPISKIKKDLSLISKYRGDSFGIEYTRFLIGTSNSVNNKSDNDVFILNVDFNAANNKNVSIDNPTLQVIKQPNIANNQLIAINNGAITGDTLAVSFALLSVSGINDRVQYVNPNAIIPVTITVIIKGTFIGTPLSGNIGGFLNDLFHVFSGKQHYNDPYPTTFRLWYNEAIISSSPIILIKNKVFKITFNANLNLSFGDELHVDISLSDTQYAGFVADIESIEYAISSSIEPPVYVLKRAAYTGSSGFDNIQYAYNIEDMTPMRMLGRHGNYLRSVLYNRTKEDLVFQTIDKNAALSVSYSGGAVITEAQSVPIGSLNSNILFYPYLFEFKTKVPITFANLMTGAANGHIQFEFNGKSFYGFPRKVSVKPSLNETQSWQLLCSPVTNLADLQDLNIDGLNYLNMSGLQTFIPHLNPDKFVPLGSVLPAGYHFEHMDSDWFINQVAFWKQKANYYRKVQNNDIVSIQCQNNGLSNVQAQLLDCHGNILLTLPLTQKTDRAIIPPVSLWEGSLALTGLAEGNYYIVLSSGSGATITQFISEGLYVKAAWPGTLLFEYTSDENKQSMIFSTGFSPSFRVEGWLDSFKPESKYAVYEDQPADIELLNAIPYRSYKLNIGDNQGVPPWVIDKINRIMLLSDVKIDGLKFTRNANTKLEEVNIPGWPMKYWSLDVREAANRDGVTLSTDGTLDSNLTVVYNIDSKAFGDGSTGIVEVTEVD